MPLKIINSLLILTAVFMGIKQGWAMLSAREDMLTMFGKWQIGKQGVMAMGAFTMMGALLILFPRTFVWGNFLMASSILLLICLDLMNKDLRAAFIELPFLLLSLIIIYLQYPLPFSTNS